MSSQSLHLSVPHNTTRDEARRRLEAGLARVVRDFGGKVSAVEQTWTGDRLDFAVAALGQRVAGQLDVGERDVDVRIVLPWLLARFADKLRPMLERETKKLLALPPGEASK